MLHYVIPTNPRYRDLAVPKLLDSMKTKQPIVVVVNNSSQYKIESDPTSNITTVYLPNNCYEYAGFIAAIKMLDQKDYIFLLHDTCEAGPEFNIIVEQFPYQKFETVDVYNGLCNFGIYSVDYLRRNSAQILSMRDIDKTQAVQIEGQLLKQNRRNGTSFPVRNKKVIYTQTGLYKDPYQTGNVRLLEYYSNIDLYKFKANWAFTKNWNVKI